MKNNATKFTFSLFLFQEIFVILFFFSFLWFTGVKVNLMGRKKTLPVLFDSLLFPPSFFFSIDVRNVP